MPPAPLSKPAAASRALATGSRNGGPEATTGIRVRSTRSLATKSAHASRSVETSNGGLKAIRTNPSEVAAPAEAAGRRAVPARLGRTGRLGAIDRPDATALLGSIGRTAGHVNIPTQAIGGREDQGAAGLPEVVGRPQLEDGPPPAAGLREVVGRLEVAGPPEVVAVSGDQNRRGQNSVERRVAARRVHGSRGPIAVAVSRRVDDETTMNSLVTSYDQF